MRNLSTPTQTRAVRTGRALVQVTLLHGGPFAPDTDMESYDVGKTITTALNIHDAADREGFVADMIRAFGVTGPEYRVRASRGAREFVFTLVQATDVEEAGR